MFKAGKFYLCLKKIDTSSESINSFISTVFGNSYRGGLFYESRRYYDYDKHADYCTTCIFYEGYIYRCSIDGALIDAMGAPVFISDSSGYEFEEVPFDNSDIEPIVTKLCEERRCYISVIPSVKFNGMILYSCKVTVVGFKNIGVGEAMAENKMNGLRLAYREARKNLLTTTKLYKSLNGYGIY